jgi:hypothetical protein
MTRLMSLSIAATVLLSSSVFAQQAQAPAAPQGGVRRLGGSIRAEGGSGPVPRTADGKPSLEGVWQGGLPVGDIAQGMRGEKIPYLPETEKAMAAHLAKDDPQAQCLPVPPPRATPYPWRVVFTPTHGFFLYEMYDYRQIFMDGRKHPRLDELDPTWKGHSIGWWEGDTLVIDTVGYNGKIWLDNRGHVVSDKLHTVERYTRKDLGNMDIQITIDDPGRYARPFTVHGVARLMPKTDELLEYICTENNQDLPYLVGPRQ